MNNQSDNQLLSSWGNFPKIVTKLQSAKEPDCDGLDQALSVACRGNGRAYSDCTLNPRLVYSSMQLKRFESFDPEHGILVAQSGVLLSEILDVFMPKGFFLAVSPGTKFASLGGAVASDVHGKDHHVTGTFSSHVLFLDIYTAEQGLVRASRTENSDLFFATIGGMGLTGFIVRVALKLKPIPSTFIQQTTYKCGSLSEIMQLFESQQDTPYSVAWIDCLNGGHKSLGRSLFMAGDFAAQTELPARYRTQAQSTSDFTSFDSVSAQSSASAQSSTSAFSSASKSDSSSVFHSSGFSKISEAYDDNYANDANDANEGNKGNVQVSNLGSLKPSEQLDQSRQALAQAYHSHVLHPLYYKQPHPKSVPFMFPSWVLNNLSMRTFNSLYYHKALRDKATALVSSDKFFYPLDAILNWNRIYGTRGFTQYQFVVPKENAEVVITSILKRIAQSHKGSFLSVLKLFGEHNHPNCGHFGLDSKAQSLNQGAMPGKTPGYYDRMAGGYLSFPMGGYTLALDFAIEPDLFALLARLDEEVIEAGGRTYLTKDVRLSERNFKRMYGANIDKFLAIKQRYDPHNKFTSLQAQRLGLIV